jgi:hypothetical protein
MRAIFRGFLIFSAASVLLATPAVAAIQVTPGQWQDTETGTEDGKPVPAKVSADCITPEEAADPVKVLTAIKRTADKCQKLEVKQIGDVVTFTMQCGDPQQMSFDIEATYTFINAKHYAGALKSTVILAGKKATSDKKIDSVWLGACKK